MIIVDIVLPCLDEADALPWVLDRIPRDARAIVVDNGSRDGSAHLAAQRGATVIECTQRGYGAACHAGLMAAEAEFVAVCDCDATLDPSDVSRFVPMLRAGADLVVGRRMPSGRGAWPLGARLANVEGEWAMERPPFWPTAAHGRASSAFRHGTQPVRGRVSVITT